MRVLNGVSTVSALAYISPRVSPWCLLSYLFLIIPSWILLILLFMPLSTLKRARSVFPLLQHPFIFKPPSIQVFGFRSKDHKIIGERFLEWPLGWWDFFYLPSLSHNPFLPIPAVCFSFTLFTSSLPVDIPHLNSSSILISISFFLHYHPSPPSFVILS